MNRKAIELLLAVGLISSIGVGSAHSEEVEAGEVGKEGTTLEKIEESTPKMSTPESVGEVSEDSTQTPGADEIKTSEDVDASSDTTVTEETDTKTNEVKTSGTEEETSAPMMNTSGDSTTTPMKDKMIMPNAVEEGEKDATDMLMKDKIENPAVEEK